MTDQEKLNYLDHRIAKLSELCFLPQENKQVSLLYQKILDDLRAERAKLQTSQPLSSVTCTEEANMNKLYQKIGLIYLIFGPTYEETFSYHNYRIEFLYQAPKPDNYCLMTIVANIFEDDKILFQNVSIDFWMEHPHLSKIVDVTISYWDESIHTKYFHHFHWFSKLAFSLAETCNRYCNTI